MAINRATILGNIGDTPVIRAMQDGTKVASFSIATTDTWKDKSGEKKSKTEWHKISVFGKLCDTIEKYCDKGTKVYLTGKLQTRKWTDKQGAEKYSTEIVLQGFGTEFEILSWKDDKPATVSDVKKHLPEAEVYDSDEIPY